MRLRKLHDDAGRLFSRSKTQNVPVDRDLAAANVVRNAADLPPSTVSTVEASRTSAEAGVDVPGGWGSWGASDVGMVVDVGPSAPDGEPDNASSRVAITAINIEATAIPVSELCNAGRRQMVRPASALPSLCVRRSGRQLPDYRSAAGAWLHGLQASR